jgi:calcineurin-like phosphoesterase family protein
MTTFFTADMHLGCDKLIEHTRPRFLSMEHHDNHLIDGLNWKVGRNDTLVIVGDFCKEKPGKYKERIICKNVFFILGNHDQEAKILRVFGGNVWRRKIVKVGQDRVVCDHHPSCYWDRSHYGVYHAYGHLHYNAEREAAMDLGFPGRRSMDVGVDAAFHHLGDYVPFSWEEMKEILASAKGHDIIEKKDRWQTRDFNTED